MPKYPVVRIFRLTVRQDVWLEEMRKGSETVSDVIRRAITELHETDGRDVRDRRGDVTLPVNGHLMRLPARPMKKAELLRCSGYDPNSVFAVFASWRDGSNTLVKDDDEVNPADELLMRLETVAG